MEVISTGSSSSSTTAFVFDQLADDFGGKLELTTETSEEGGEFERSDFVDDVSGGDGEVEGDLEDGEEEAEFEFSFVNQDGSPVSADDIFKDGQIQPMFPLFNRALLYSSDEEEEGERKESSSSSIASVKKVFVREEVGTTSSGSEELAEGTYCEWSSEKSTEVKKSNSTGFSRRWRFRDLIMHRSSSDGKDTFVFLNHNHSHANSNTNITSGTTSSSAKPTPRTTVVGVKAKTTSSSSKKSEIEKYVTRSKATKEGERRKSYLPYRPVMVGFFASSNGFSRNIHPY